MNSGNFDQSLTRDLYNQVYQKVAGKLNEELNGHLALLERELASLEDVESLFSLV